MEKKPGFVQGSVKMRPWRVGQLIDISSVEQVKNAIKACAPLWGGTYMPLLSAALPENEIISLTRRYGIDSLHTEIEDERLKAIVDKPGYSWKGQGQFGPFGTGRQLHFGLLRSIKMLNSGQVLRMPSWSQDDNLDLFYRATWGMPYSESLTLKGITEFVEEVSIEDLIARGRDSDPIGLLELSTSNIKSSMNYSAEKYFGVFVIRGDSPTDVVKFWNFRASGGLVIPISDSATTVLRFALAEASRRLKTRELRTSSNEEGEPVLQVWGFEQLEESCRSIVEEWITKEGIVISNIAHEDGHDPYQFSDLHTPFKRSFKKEFEPGYRGAEIPLPSVPVWDGFPNYAEGIVAADIRISGDSNQDPRVATCLPPFARLSTLLEKYATRGGAEQAHVSSEGVVLGVHVNSESVSLPFFYHLDIFREFLSDANIAVSQSNEGLFQSRAADVFGGIGSDAANQPGVRAAILETAEKRAGIVFQHLRAVIDENRGNWPDQFFGRTGGEGYADYQAKVLLNTGLLVPMLDVKCTFCNVTSHVHPRDLDAILECEFCGESSKLALALTLVNRPQWRYRLAGHLSPAKIGALLPVLSTMSVLGNVYSPSRSLFSHVLGLEFKPKGADPIEVDVAAVFGGHHPMVIIGEVKSSNRIDANDISNLERVQRMFLERDVRCMILISTLKERLSEVETSLIREYLNRFGQTVSTPSVLPLTPLILTGGDLSQPWGSDNHPWRWPSPGSGSGIFGIAIESCKRNLGLEDYELTRGDKVEFNWTAN